MTPPRIKRMEDGTVVPAPGWEWCPYCDGEGTVTATDCLSLDEHTHECGFCDDGIRRGNAMTDDPVTAHGWTATTADDYGAALQHWGGNVTGLGHAARADLARCIEDAALLAEARQLAARVDNWCRGCRGPVSPHLEDLLYLLTEDGTP